MTDARAAHHSIRLLLLCLTLATPLVSNSELPAEGDSIADGEDWFDDPFFDEQSRSTDHISDGELRFIEPITERRVLTTEATLKITEDSMLTGLVDMYQCYSQLDAVPAVDIVYSFDEIHSMEIMQSSNIGSARVNGHALQLENVGADAEVCVKSTIRILEETTADNFRLRYGPYYRRFLDGYYPYHVVLNVDYPGEQLAFSSISPQPGKSYEVRHTDNNVSIDAWFEGILMIDMRMTAVEAKQ